MQLIRTGITIAYQNDWKHASIDRFPVWWIEASCFITACHRCSSVGTDWYWPVRNGCACRWNGQAACTEAERPVRKRLRASTVREPTAPAARRATTANRRTRTPSWSYRPSRRHPTSSWRSAASTRTSPKTTRTTARPTRAGRFVASLSSYLQLRIILLTLEPFIPKQWPNSTTFAMNCNGL